MRKISILISILFVATSIMAKSPQVSNEDLTQIRKFNQFYLYLKDNYVEEIDMESLVESAITEMLLGLDPHSSYISSDDMKGVNESLEGEFSGIGIEFNILADTVIVVNTIVGAPAESIGMMPNDRIITVDGEDIVGIKRSDVPGYLRGERGSKVQLGVVRHSEPEPLSFVVERDNIPINTVDAAYMLNDTTAYIKINRFGQTTYDEFNEAYKALGEQQTLVLDLRGNGGGLLSQAINLANFFLPKGVTIVSTEGLNDEPREMKTTRNGSMLSGNVVVMIDEDSASASEIVAGALQDWDRGVIVGKPSFGKGLVQRQFPLIDGSVARITVAHYHTPTGRVIQRPYEAGEGKEYFERHIKRYSNDSLALDTVARPAYQTLRYARTVYGGGGITPDIIIASDTTRVDSYYISLIRQSVVNEFVISYLDSNRDKLSRRYPTFESFNADFEIDDSMLEELIALGDKRGVERKDSKIEDFKDIARVNLKALFAQKLFDTTEFYRVVNENDESYFPLIDNLLENWESQTNKIFSPN